MYWSCGAEDATKKVALVDLRRPARPACCQVLATLPGYPQSTQASNCPMSMPSSSAFVETTALTVPSRRPRSISRRSVGRYPPR